jgi:hypothetical protein
MPEKDIPMHNPDSEEFNPFYSFDVAFYGLKKAQARFKQSVIDKNATREMLIKNAKAIIQAGGNPADVEGWEETAKKFNITPEDLK